MVNGYMPLPSDSAHRRSTDLDLVMSLGSHGVMTLFRVVVCVPTRQLCFDKVRADELTSVRPMCRLRNLFD